MAEKYQPDEAVASILNINNEEDIAATTQGHLRGFKDGSSWKFRREDVDKYEEDLRNAVSADDFGYGDDYELDDSVSAVGGSSDINNTLDNDVSFSAGESGLALEMYSDDDDDLVLGGESSSIGLSEQSGISLMSATDSGISLDDDESGEVLELGEDNLKLGSSILGGSLAASLSVASLSAADDFSLTTDEEEEDGDDSGSQIIMLDDAGLDDYSDGTDFEEGGNDDDLGVGATGDEFEADGMESAEAGVQTQFIPQIVPMDMPEKPYSTWTVVGLLFCFVFLTVTMLFTVDLIRNIWSWDKTPYSSALMDWAINTFIDK